MFGQMLVEGAARAVQLVPLLFVLNSTPAAAQLPRPATAEPPFALPVEEAPLILTEHHVVVRVQGGQAYVRSLLTYRNERAEPVSTSFAFPFPALLQQGQAWRALGAESIEPADDCGVDESAEDAEFLEAGERVPPRIDVGYVTVAPGEEIQLETHRRVELVRRGDGYRFALPLPVDRRAPYAPQFSADVFVEEPQAIARLASSTHGGSVSGTGSTHAQLTVPIGRAYLGSQFVVDIELAGRATALNAARAGAR